MRVTKRATAAEMATLRGLKGEIMAEGFQRMEGEARRAAFDQLGRGRRRSPWRSISGVRSAVNPWLTAELQRNPRVLAPTLRNSRMVGAAPFQPSKFF